MGNANEGSSMTQIDAARAGTLKPGELQARRAEDPVLRMRAALIADGVLTEDEAAAIEVQAKAEVQDAFEFAEASPVPDLAELLTDVYEGV